MKEKPKHIDAFHYFFALTEKGHTITDSIKITSEHVGVLPRTVWKWYTEFDWNTKSDVKRAKIIKEMEEKENQTLAQNRANYLNILHKELDDFIKADFPAKIESIKDLEIVIKNCLLLQEAPTEVTKTSNVDVKIDASDFFDEELMDKIIEEELEAEQELKEELKNRKLSSDEEIISFEEDEDDDLEE